MQVPFDQANLTIHCMIHSCDIEYEASMDSVHILDKLQLYCPGLNRAIMGIHRQIDRVNELRSSEQALAYRACHPEEVAQMPRDWMPGNSTTIEDLDEAGRVRVQPFVDRIADLYSLIDKYTDECYNSWVITLERKEDNEHNPRQPDEAAQA